MPDSQPQPAYDLETDRRTSSEILEQARWLFEQHEGRNDSAQKAAATVLTATGSLVALVTKALPSAPRWWQIVLMGLVAASGLITVILCVLVLRPRDRENGLPSIGGLRKFAKTHDEQQRVPLPPSQFAVDMLNAKNLEAKSPLDHAAEDAKTRMCWLSRAYVGLAITFFWIMVLTVLVAVVK